MNIKKIKKIVNLTPHEVNLVLGDGKVVTFPSLGVIRLPKRTEVVGKIATSIDGREVEIPLSKTSFGKAEGLPEREEGTIFIVSSLICQACPDRDDFFIVDQTTRDKDGRIVGCRSLSQNPFRR